MADVTREIKTTIALDGEKAFNSSMAEAARNMKVLGSEMKLNTAEFKQSGSSLESLTDKQKTLGGMQSQQQKIVEALTKAVEESAAAYGESDKRTDEYRVKLNNAKAALVDIDGQLERTSKQIDEFGNETENAEKKTIDWKETLEKLDQQLDKGIKVAGAALAAIAALGAAVVAAGKQVWDATVDMGKFADGLLTTAEQTGISTTALQEWGYASQFIDTEVETITKSMAKMTKGLLDAKEGTGKNAEAFELLGVSLKDSSGNLRKAEDIFYSAIDALGKVGNETERDAIAMQLFGKSALELNPLINAGSEAFKALGAEAQNMGLIMSEDTVGAFGAFDDSMNVMNSTIDAVKTSFLTAMLPAMEKIGGVVQMLVDKFNDWLKSDGAQALLASLTDKIGSLAENIGDNLGPIIDGIIGTFETVISTIGWVIENADLLKTTIILLTSALFAMKVIQLGVTVAQWAMNAAMTANPIGAVIMAITALIAGIVLLIANWGTVKEVFINAWEGIKNAWGACVDFFKGVWEGIKTAFASPVPWFKEKFSAAWEGIKNAWAGVTGFFKNIWSSIQDAFGSADTWMSDKFGGAWDGIKKAFEPFVNFFKQIWETVKGIFSVVKSVLTGDFQGAWDGIKGIFSSWGDYFKNLWQNVKDAFSGAGAAMLQVGKDMLAGIWNGITSTVGWLTDKITGWLSGMWTGIKSFFGIKSPSKLMADTIGKPMAQGIALGFTDNLGLVTDAMGAIEPMLNMGVNTRAEQSVTANFSDTALSRIITGLADVMMQRDDLTIVLNDREFGRAVRKVAMA